VPIVIPKKMKQLTLEQAARLIADSEAIQRGYIDQQLIEDAQELAAAALAMGTFGKTGYHGEIGDPHQWWEENSEVYKTFAESATYRKARRFSYLLSFAEYMIADDRREIFEDRWKALEVMRKRDLLDDEGKEELKTLSAVLKFPAKK
jgi:hypothetical protein